MRSFSSLSLASLGLALLSCVEQKVLQEPFETGDEVFEDTLDSIIGTYESDCYRRRPLIGDDIYAQVTLTLGEEDEGMYRARRYTDEACAGEVSTEISGPITYTFYATESLQLLRLEWVESVASPAYIAYAEAPVPDFDDPEDPDERDDSLYLDLNVIGNPTCGPHPAEPEASWVASFLEDPVQNGVRFAKVPPPESRR